MKLVNSFFLSFIVAIQLATLPHVKAADVWDFLNKVVPPPTHRIGYLRHKNMELLRRQLDEDTRRLFSQMQTDTSQKYHAPQQDGADEPTGTMGTFKPIGATEIVNDYEPEEIPELAESPNFRSQKVLPMQSTPIPSKTDILVGQSLHLRNWLGNTILKDLISFNFEKYFSIRDYDKTDKPAIAYSILNTLIENGMNFFKLKNKKDKVGPDPLQSEWLMLPYKESFNNISSRFRNMKKQLCNYDPFSSTFHNTWKELFGSRKLPTQDWWKKLCDPEESQRPAKRQKLE